MSKILLTGGAGYIGTHTAVELLNSGYDVIIADNYSNSSPEAVKRVEKIANKPVKAYEIDVKDTAELDRIFTENKIDAVIHFAGAKAVGESVVKPLMYYRNNLDSLLSVLETAAHHDVHRIVFSSSATVYGETCPMPCVETFGRGSCTNPYGWTKAMCEQILEDAVKADKHLSVILLRYFNPVGAHPSGLIGEAPNGIPNNLMPYVTQTAAGKRECLTIFGNDYPTPDGTCLRDFIHVSDLATGHVKAIDYLLKNDGLEIFNIGTGEPHSVTEVVETFERVTGVKIPHSYGKRREGDLAVCYADAKKAESILGWKAEKTLVDMCRDAWNWQSNNPNGYE